MTAVNSVSHITNNTSANNNKQAHKYTPKTSHAGLYTGIATAAIPVSLNIYGHKLLETVGIQLQRNKYSKYFAIPLKVISVIAAGAFTDKVIQEKNTEFNEKIKGKTAQEAVSSDKRGRATKKGNPYYNSNTGKKFGAVMGTFMLPVLTMISTKKIGSIKLNSILGILGLLVGMTLGSTTDKYANKTAMKNADKMQKIKSANSSIYQ